MVQFNCESSTIAPYQCRKCNFSTLFLRNLKHHSASNGSEIVTPNYICTKSCTFQTHSKLLIRLHENECFTKNWLKCDHSNYRAKRKETLQKHITNKHHGTKLKKRKNSFEKKWFECDLCTYKCQWKSVLKRHNLRTHINKNEINWFECDHCNYKNMENRLLQQHILYKHTSDEKINWLKCDYCIYKCKRRDHLQSHIIHKHTNPDEMNWFECDQCPYKAKRNSNLQQHNKIHLFENLQCYKCNSKLENKKKLKDHLLQHDKLFKCDFCPYKTQHKQHLKRHHNNKHVDENKIKWFICYHCNHKTKDKGNLKQHILCKHSSHEKI